MPRSWAILPHADGGGVVADLPDGFIGAGFSNGAGMAEYVATQRRCAGVLLFSGALPPAMMGVPAWPAGYRSSGTTPSATVAEPGMGRRLRGRGAGRRSARGGRRPSRRGHLFTDRSLPDEYDAAATEVLWERALDFCARVGAQSPAR